VRSKSLAKLAPYLTHVVKVKRKAMSEGALSDPSLVGSNYVNRCIIQTKTEKKRGTLKNARGSKES
jgi:hypothetical protein